MKIKPILTGKNNPTLRGVSEEVKHITPDILSLCTQMIRSMKAEKQGIGIAAPQIGVLKRIIIVTLQNNIHTMINPEISSFSAECEIQEEGCLSLPTYFGQVSRSKTICVKYQDELGKKQEKTLSGLDARVVQHEIDHLNGILFSDREVQTSSQNALFANA